MLKEFRFQREVPMPSERRQSRRAHVNLPSNWEDLDDTEREQALSEMAEEMARQLESS